MVNMDKVDDGVFDFFDSCPAAPAGFQVAPDFSGPAEWKLPVFQKKQFLIGNMNLLFLHSITFDLHVRGGPAIASSIWTRRPETCPIPRRFHDSEAFRSQSKTMLVRFGKRTKHRTQAHLFLIH